MTVRHEWEELSGEPFGDNTDIIDKKILVDEEIDIQGRFGFSIERLADRGLKIKHTGEDEFGLCESLTEVILTKADLDRIKELEQKGLI